jgi:hypothetical protein
VPCRYYLQLDVNFYFLLKNRDIFQNTAVIKLVVANHRGCTTAVPNKNGAMKGFPPAPKGQLVAGTSQPERAKALFWYVDDPDSAMPGSAGVPPASTGVRVATKGR